jgi:hypothetical protein
MLVSPMYSGTAAAKKAADATARKLRVLTEAFDKECEANQKLVDSSAGQPVLYGQIIQLFHVKSHGFLHVSVNSISLTERNASSVLVGDSLGRYS